MSDLKPLNVLDEERFEALLALHETGSHLALLEALGHCLKNNVQAPAWVLAGARQSLVQFVRGDRRKSGRAAAGLSRDRQTLVHFSRWDLVCECREAREHYKTEFEALRALPGTRARAEARRIKVIVHQMGRNLEDLFAYVSSLVRGTPIAGSPETIRASYKRVQRDMTSRKTASRYTVCSPHTLREFGLSGLDMVPGNKLPGFLTSDY